MKVVITRGYGGESKNQRDHQIYLDDFKKWLNSLGLPVEAMESERPTGGRITLTINNDCDPDIVTSCFLSVVTSLARKYTQDMGEEREVSLDLLLPGFSESITILGSPN